VAVDAAVLGNNVRGEAAARSEREANLRRTNTMKKGVANVAAAQRVKGAGRGGSKGGSKGSGGGVPGVPGGLDAGNAAACAAQALTQLRALFANDPSGMMELFREIDTSGDGLVSRSEFGLAIRALGLHLPKTEFALLFATLDPDGSGEIEYHELRAALESNGDGDAPGAADERGR